MVLSGNSDKWSGLMTNEEIKMATGKKRKKLMILVRKILILDLMYSPQREGSQREQNKIKQKKRKGK